MSNSFRPATMLICIVPRHRGEQVVAVAKAAGARGGTIAIGRGMSANTLLLALSLGDVAQEVVFILLGQEAPAVIAAVLDAAEKFPKKLQGFALALDVAGMSARTEQPDGPASVQAPIQDLLATRSIRMDSGSTLITVIVNHGYADDVMAVARKAGAAGGTILNARGTGTAEDVKFFGISLVPEKEMLLIVAGADKADAIVEAVNTIPNLSAPGGGIVYSMNVEGFRVLGT